MKMLEIDFYLVCVKEEGISLLEREVSKMRIKGHNYISGVLGPTMVLITIGQKYTLGLVLFSMKYLKYVVTLFQMLEEVFHNLDPDGTMSVEDFFYGLFKNGKSLTPSASTPYRQLKRHLSMQVKNKQKCFLCE